MKTTSRIFYRGHVENSVTVHARKRSIVVQVTKYLDWTLIVLIAAVTWLIFLGAADNALPTACVSGGILLFGLFMFRAPIHMSLVVEGERGQAVITD